MDERANRAILENRPRFEQGVSIIYALLFMLVVTMVSVLVLGAATTALKNVHNDKKWEQDSLELESAGKALQSYLNTTVSESALNVTIDSGSGKITATPVDANNKYAALLQEAIEYTYSRGNNSKKEETNCIVVDPSALVGEYRSANVSLRVRLVDESAEGKVIKNYHVTLSVSLPDSKQVIYIYAYYNGVENGKLIQFEDYSLHTRDPDSDSKYAKS